MYRGLKWVAAAAVGALFLSSVGLTALWGLGRTQEYCSWCHAMEPYYASWAESDYLAGTHRLSDITCQQCHPQSLDDLLHEIVVTLSDSYSVPLPELKLGDQACFSCHDDYRSLAEGTHQMNPNPHDTHLGEEECRSCHRMHKASPGLGYCTTCHHTGDLIHCNQCHEEVRS